MSNMNAFDSDEDFKYLKGLKMKQFINIVKTFVHYYQFETNYRHLIDKNCRSEEEITKLWEWKKNMPSYFKNHLILSCEGFERTYKLIRNN